MLVFHSHETYIFLNLHTYLNPILVPMIHSNHRPHLRPRHSPYWNCRSLLIPRPPSPWLSLKCLWLGWEVEYDTYLPGVNFEAPHKLQWFLRHSREQFHSREGGNLLAPQ